MSDSTLPGLPTSLAIEIFEIPGRKHEEFRDFVKSVEQQAVEAVLVKLRKINDSDLDRYNQLVDIEIGQIRQSYTPKS